MAVVPVYKRNVYNPMSEDSNLRQRIQNNLDARSNFRKSVAENYPDRGKDIETKVRMMLNGMGRNKVITENIPDTSKEIIHDTLCVIAVYGSSMARITAQKRAIELLSQMNPLPRIVVVEASLDGQWRFDYVKSNSYIDYVPLDLQGPEFNRLFVKEQLWNVGAHIYLDNGSSVEYLVFLDADTFFVDRKGWSDIRQSFNLYSVISPYKYCYYTGDHEEAKKYKLMPSKGYQVARDLTTKGYQGFGIGLTRNIYETYFHGELPCPCLGFGDVFMWYMLTGDTKYKSVNMLPYNESECSKYIFKSRLAIGYTNQIIGHIDHGPLKDRLYNAKCQLMRMCIPFPLTELKRSNKYRYILEWADTPNVQDLRWTYEHFLIENRREIKISSKEDMCQFYNFIHGCNIVPEAMKRNVFTQNLNNMPNMECSIQIPDKNTGE